MIKTNRLPIQLLNFPAWALVLFWLVAPRKKKGEPVTEVELTNRKDLLRVLYYSLPVPHNWPTRIIVTILINWINIEEKGLRQKLILNEFKV